jgi:uncharacterized protein (DUF4415 family)
MGVTLVGAFGDHRKGDKVRVRFGPSAGHRGIVTQIDGGTISVRLASGAVVDVQVNDLTNYSLASRRAWQTMPKRAGRPKMGNPRNKMLSLRLDADVWDLLGRASELGLTPNRQRAINEWLRQTLLQAVNQANRDRIDTAAVQNQPQPSAQATRSAPTDTAHVPTRREATDL